MSAPDTCWIVTEGKPGMERQGLGLAKALQMPFETKRVQPRFPWRQLPYWIFPRDPRKTLDENSSVLAEPWPRVLIATGRQSIPFSIAIRKWSGGKTFTVQTQSPKVPAKLFDLVVPPLHDRLTGPNVFPIVGAPHPVTPRALAAAREAFAARFKALPTPRIAVLIGGASKTHALDEKRAREIARDLSRLAEAGAGLMVTTSRRTGEENARTFREALARPNVVFWDGAGLNPYEAMLGWADAILVTADSVNMTVEASVTGKPVHVIALAGRSAKFDRFHADMAARGITRPFKGTLDAWTYPPLQETARAAAEIKRRLAAVA